MALTDEQEKILKEQHQQEVNKLNADIETLKTALTNKDKDIADRDKQIEEEQRKAFEYWKMIPQTPIQQSQTENQDNKYSSLDDFINTLY